MNFQSSDFELFGLQARFRQDQAVLEASWKRLQSQAHPDKFASHDAAAQRLSLQWSVRINEAYQRLKNPLKRAAYLCELGGVPINLESNAAMPTGFLVQQMEWRESLEDAKSIDDLSKIASQSALNKRDQLSKLEQLIDAESNLTAAAEVVRSLMFAESLIAEVENRIDQLEP